MRKIATFVGLLILACPAATSETVVVGSLYLPSSPVLELTVVRKAKPAGGVAVAIYRYDRSDEVQFWIGETDPTGLLLLPKLPLGRYRISADAGKRNATLYLEVKEEEKPVTRFQMRLIRRDLDGAEDAPPSAWVADFRGSVFDQSGAAVPQAQIDVFRKDSVDDGPFLQMRSDEKGNFSAHLDKGTYVAVFVYRGFKTHVLVFEVTEKGKAELRVSLEVGSVA